ncbi:hypothetical protein BJ965_003599 [Streptomyces luteogriseus]|uniref:Uncharacterized protein n=1 Tax=Streptomyces luteogriseus TaxID=68233 RepID=A0A7W7GFZ1_9ACTN|nr:hypothetical protein [Streptomyces luteogriseus]
MTESTGARRGGAPASRGRTVIADVVVQKIAVAGAEQPA